MEKLLLQEPQLMAKAECLEVKVRLRSGRIKNARYNLSHFRSPLAAQATQSRQRTLIYPKTLFR